jgi:hypothetical protein
MAVGCFGLADNAFGSIDVSSDDLLSDLDSDEWRTDLCLGKELMFPVLNLERLDPSSRPAVSLFPNNRRPSESNFEREDSLPTCDNRKRLNDWGLATGLRAFRYATGYSRLPAVTPESRNTWALIRSKPTPNRNKLQKQRILERYLFVKPCLTSHDNTHEDSAKAKQKAMGSSCVNNPKQMMLASVLYVRDSSDKIVSIKKVMPMQCKMG